MYQVSGSHRQCSEVRQDMEASPSSCLMHAAESEELNEPGDHRHGQGYFRETSALTAGSSSSTAILQHSTWDNSTTHPRLLLYSTVLRLECTY